MTFSEAIKDGFDHYVKFDGRASRPAYWWWFLFAVLVGIATNIVDIGVFDGSPILRGIIGLALFLPGLSVSIRRLHDTNRSGWWVLLALIPIIGFIVLLVFYLQPSDPTENRFGPPPVPSAPPAPSPA